MQDFQDEFEDDNVKVLMIDVDNSESAAQVIAWMNQNGVTTVTCLLQGSSIYNWFGDGYIPYNVFLDPDFIVRFTASGYSQTYYNQWCALAEEYAGSWDYPVFQHIGYEVIWDENGDYAASPGESLELQLSVSNRTNCPSATGITASVTSYDPYVTILDGELTFPDLDGGESGTANESLQLEISPDAIHDVIIFQVEMNSPELPEPQQLSFQLPLEVPCEPPTLEIEYVFYGGVGYATLLISGGTGEQYLIERSIDPYSGFEFWGIVLNTPEDPDLMMYADPGNWFYRVRSDCE